jgi:altronate hydrolase
VGRLESKQKEATMAIEIGTRDAVRGSAAFNDVAIILDPIDVVGIAKKPLMPGTTLKYNDGSEIRITQMIPPGHKFALQDIDNDVPVRRYGQIIGFSTAEIKTGQHVHVQNLSIKEQGSLKVDYAIGTEYKPEMVLPESERRTFRGFKRADGRVGTRNYVAVLASVNCSSSATVAVVNYFNQPGALKDFPNVDGVIGFPHKGGCGAHIGSRDLLLFQRTLAGIVNHPNVAGYLVLSLGCEVNQPTDMIEATVMKDDNPTVITIQQDGGFSKTVELGIEAVKKLLPAANNAVREEVSVEHLVLALQCGGSDGWSGVTANPALGKAADLLVKHGGTAMLGETTEVYGAEHLLTRRARNPEVAEKLIGMIHWWEDYTAYFGGTIDNNPSPGNKLGGLTTIYEKSLGAVAKGGSMPLNEVLGYGERVSRKGFVHMDTPGYDPVSVTGQVAGGSNIVCFTTGRGSAFGFKPAPSIKLATNSDLYAKQEPDMDINCGRVLDGISLDQMGEEIFEEIIAVASGKPSKSELAGVGAEEFNPWILGAML